MLTNKRDLKKYVNRICADVAQTLLPAAVYAKAITEEKADEILTELSTLQAKALSRISISFDKAPDTFADIKAYHAAKKVYYKAAYNKLVSDFEEGVEKLIKPVNESIKAK